MYRSCIYCSADLGSNEVLEDFPVGRSLAYDGWKGRLWAICRRCRRWNLAPIEERWEAVEEAEKRFRDCRLRAHSERIGLAKLPDGTRLIRVGEAVPLELATWRYGAAIQRRRRSLMLGAGGTIGGAALMLGGLPLIAMGAIPTAGAILISQVVTNALLVRHSRAPMVRIPAHVSPTGREMVLRRQLGYHARVVESRSGDGLAVELPAPLPPERVQEGRLVRWVAAPALHLEGELAVRFLERALVSANGWSSGRRRLQSALERLDAAGGPEGLLQSVGKQSAGLFPSWLATNAPGYADARGGVRRLVGSFRGEIIGGGGWRPPLPREVTLALEIAVHHEAERRVLEGELDDLETAWREAEEIAAIADVLPHDPLEALQRD